MTNDQNLRAIASHHASVDGFGLIKDQKRVFRARKGVEMLAGGGWSRDVGWEMFASGVVISYVRAIGFRLYENG
jgi:hypothetical protein